MIRIFAKVCAFFCLLTFAAISYGQGGASTGDLHVTVKDPKGNLVGNATVTVRDVAKGLERTANGDGQGGYNAPLLPPGTYAVRVEAPGFSKIEDTGVVITVGGTLELPIPDQARSKLDGFHITIPGKRYTA